MEKGHLNPITSVIREISTIFNELGFSVAAGPELEDEFHNFDALNIPKDHPARDMQDTFWVKGTEKEGGSFGENKVLRTHTSSVQVRFMEQVAKLPKTEQKPFKIIVPGKVYRNEATDATHEAQFYQIEGLYVNKNVSMAELKGTLDYFFKKLLGADAKIRFRSSFFGFVEPGVEVDVWHNGKWLEVMGAGIVHPNVIKACGLDPQEWKGFAFGGGIDRLAIIKYGIDDIRHFYQGDLRFTTQF